MRAGSREQAVESRDSRNSLPETVPSVLPMPSGAQHPERSSRSTGVTGVNFCHVPFQRGQPAV